MANPMDDLDNFKRDATGKISAKGLKSAITEGEKDSEGNYIQQTFLRSRNDTSDRFVNSSSPVAYGNLFKDDYYRDDELYDLGRLYQGYSVNNLRGEVQPWWEQIGRGVLKGTILAGTTFIDGTVGVVAGLINMAAGNGNNLDEFINNPVTQAMDKIVNASEEYLPNYYTKRQEEISANDPISFENIFSANFLGDKFIKNLGFTFGAIYGGGFWSKGFSLGMKLAKGVETLTGASSAISTLITTGLAAATEAAVEVRNNAPQRILPTLQEIDDEYAKKKKEIENTQYADPTKKDEDLLKLDQKYAESKEFVDKLRIEMGNSMFVTETIFLWMSNLLQFAKVLKGGWNTASRSSKVRGSLESGYKASKIKYMGLAMGAKNAAAEGFEEGFQEATARGMGFGIEGGLKNAYEHIAFGKDIDQALANMDYLKSMSDGFKDAFVEDNASTLEQMMVGAFTGMTGLVRIGKKNNAGSWLGKDKMIGLSGGFIGEAVGYKQERLYEEELAERMTNSSFRTKKTAESVFQSGCCQDIMDAAVQRGDKKTFLDYKDKQMMSDLVAFYETGRLQDIKDMIGNINVEESIDDLIMLLKNRKVANAASTLPPELQGILDIVESTETALGTSDREEIKNLIQKNLDNFLEAIDDIEYFADEISRSTVHALDTEELGEAVYLRALAQGKQRRSEEIASKLNEYLKKRQNTVLNDGGAFENFVLSLQSTSKEGLISKFLQLIKVRNKKEADRARISKNIKKGNEAIKDINDYVDLLNIIKTDPELTGPQQKELLDMLEDLKTLQDDKLELMNEVGHLLKNPDLYKKYVERAEQSLSEQYRKRMDDRLAEELNNAANVEMALSMISRHGNENMINRKSIQRAINNPNISEEIKKALKEYLEYRDKVDMFLTEFMDSEFMSTALEAQEAAALNDKGIDKQTILAEFIGMSNAATEWSKFKESVDQYVEAVNDSKALNTLNESVETSFKEAEELVKKAEETNKKTTEDTGTASIVDLIKAAENTGDTNTNTSNTEGTTEQPTEQPTESVEPPAAVTSEEENKVLEIDVNVDTDNIESVEKAVKEALEELSLETITNIMTGNIEINSTNNIIKSIASKVAVEIFTEKESKENNSDTEDNTEETEDSEDFLQEITSNDTQELRSQESENKPSVVKMINHVFTEYLIGPLLDKFSRSANINNEPGADRYIRAMRVLGAYEIINNGALKDLYNYKIGKYGDFKVHYIVINKESDDSLSDVSYKINQEGKPEFKVLLAVEVDKNFKFGNPIKDETSGKYYQVIGSVSDNDKSDHSVRKAVFNSIKNELNGTDFSKSKDSNKSTASFSRSGKSGVGFRIFVSQKYFTRFSNFYSGRISKASESTSTRNKPLRELPYSRGTDGKLTLDELTGNKSKRLGNGIAIKYGDNAFAKTFSDGDFPSVSINSKHTDIMLNGSLWLVSRAADGVSYYTRLTVARLTKDYLREHSYKEEDGSYSPILKEIKDALEVIVNRDTSLSQKLDAKIALKKLLYFKEGQDIKFNYTADSSTAEGKVKQDSFIRVSYTDGAGTLVTSINQPMINANIHETNTDYIEKQVNAILDRLVDLNLRFQVSSKGTVGKDITDSSDVKDLFNSDVLLTDLDKLDRVNASVDMMTPSISRSASGEYELSSESENDPNITKKEATTDSTPNPISNIRKNEAVVEQPIEVFSKFKDEHSNTDFTINSRGEVFIKNGEQVHDIVTIGRVKFAYDISREESKFGSYQDITTLFSSSTKFRTGIKIGTYEGNTYLYNDKTQTMYIVPEGVSIDKVDYDISKIIDRIKENIQIENADSLIDFKNNGEYDWEMIYTAAMFLNHPEALKLIEEKESKEVETKNEIKDVLESTFPGGYGTKTNIIKALESKGYDGEEYFTNMQNLNIVEYDDDIREYYIDISKNLPPAKILESKTEDKTKNTSSEAIEAVSTEDGYASQDGDILDNWDNPEEVKSNDNPNSTNNVSVELDDIDLDEDHTEIPFDEDEEDFYVPEKNVATSKSKNDEVTVKILINAANDPAFARNLINAARKEGFNVRNGDFRSALLAIKNTHPLRMLEVESLEDMVTLIEEIEKC